MVLTDAPKSYLYGEYADDADLQATRNAFNAEANGIFQWLQNNPIADYRADPINATLLDWVAMGVYNMTRKVLVSATSGSVRGSYGDVAVGDSPFAGGKTTQSTSQALTLTDDQFRRAITWNIYSGDGWTFSTPWLRRRIARFIFTANGYGDVAIGDEQLVSIQWIALRTATIYVTAPAASLQTARAMLIGLNNGYLQVPIGYSFDVTVINFQVTNTDFGGDIL